MIQGDNLSIFLAGGGAGGGYFCKRKKIFRLDDGYGKILLGAFCIHYNVMKD